MSDIPLPAAKRRILMVDDHPIVREGMAKFLNVQDDLHLCCEAGNAPEALEMLQTCNPDLAIVDMTLRGESGLELVKTLRHRQAQLPILVMSMHDEGLFAERALRAGANGYVMKLEATTHVLLAIRQVLSGNIYLSETMHNRITRRLLAPGKPPRGPIASLTEREFEVLHLIGLGFGTRQIAEKLSRSVKTIETHRAHLMQRLQVDSVAKLVRYAVSTGLVSPAP